MTRSVTNESKDNTEISEEKNRENVRELPQAHRNEVFKTYKLFIGNTFPRSESGRYYRVPNSSGRVLNMSRASRKDLRNSVRAALSASTKWQNTKAYLRGQILYRIAEVMESRSEQFINELWNLGAPRSEAVEEVNSAIDLLVYYAGWCDKYDQIFSTVNPVSSAHFNFSTLEPVGIVGVIAPESSGILGLVSCIAPIIAGGNVCVVLASRSLPVSAITFAEALAVSDVPAGVVNILTGFEHELSEHFCSHMEIACLLLARDESESFAKSKALIANNMKRFVRYSEVDLIKKEYRGPYLIKDFQEVKTIWHPVGL